LLDLKAQYSTIRSEIREAIERVVESQHFILGPEVEGLEREIAPSAMHGLPSVYHPGLMPCWRLS
jgi:dTDP-4-amino-4,6-dideoxygalactose transaminase